MNKRLILITAGFPFGTHETFLETEIGYLCEGFEQVTIVAVDPTSDKLRTVPPNCTVVGFDAQLSGLEKLLSSLGIFNNRVWKELRVIKKVYRQRVTIGKIKTILISLARAQKIRRKLELLTPLNDQTVLYSYWCDDAALAIALLKEYKQKFTGVSRVHGWDVYFEVHPLQYLPFRHYITVELDVIYPISQKGKDYIINRWKVSDPSNIIVSRLGVISQAQITPSDNFTVVSCSNLIPLKRVELIIEALARIQHQSIRWTHFGDGKEKARLIDLASRKLGSNINWEFKGHVPNAAVIQWYKENNPSLFINVSSSEGIPVSIMEAMSFGIPVVATNVGGTSEIVNERNGKLLSETPTSQEISDAICTFFESSNFQLKSEGALLTWEEQYNGEKNYLAFIQGLLYTI